MTRLHNKQQLWDKVESTLKAIQDASRFKSLMSHTGFVEHIDSLAVLAREAESCLEELKKYERINNVIELTDNS